MGAALKAGTHGMQPPLDPCSPVACVRMAVQLYCRTAVDARDAACARGIPEQAYLAPCCWGVHACPLALAVALARMTEQLYCTVLPH